MFRVPKADGDSQTEQHQSPVDFRDVDLTTDFRRRVYYLDPRKATQCTALLDDGEGAGDDSLTSHHCSKNGDCKNRPP